MGGDPTDLRPGALRWLRGARPPLPQALRRGPGGRAGFTRRGLGPAVQLGGLGPVPLPEHRDSEQRGHPGAWPLRPPRRRKGFHVSLPVRKIQRICYFSPNGKLKF